MTKHRTARSAVAVAMLVAAVLVGSVGVPAPASAAPSGPVGWADGSPYEAFLAAAADDLYGRPLTASELEGLLGRFAARATLTTVVREMVGTDAAVEELVEGLFSDALKRAAGPADTAYWGGRLRGGATTVRITIELLAAAEVYRQAGSDPGAYVDLLYERVLDRPADAAGRAYWAATIERGQPRSTVVRRLVGTPESRGERVDRLYRRLLDRNPDAAGRTYWVGRLARFDDLDLLVSLVASGEYRARATAHLDLASNWDVESPEAHGMDAAALDAALGYAFGTPSYNTQGVVVVRDGVIVSERYAAGRTRDSWGASWSVAKSFASAMIGIAIADGDIESVDQPMTTWIPEWEGTSRADITLRDVLTMSSGLQWNEDYDPSSVLDSDIIQMVLFSSDQLAYAISRPSEAEPGTRWQYSSGDSMLLSRVIEEATGLSAHEFARTRIFEPLGMDRAELWSDAAGHGLTYCCLDTTSRGFARFGQLYLQGGEWAGEQVVPTEWVDDSWAPAATWTGYGYQWWRSTVDGYEVASARGHDGQYIMVVPELDLVVVRNGTYDKYAGPPVADPNLFVRYPSGGLVAGQGTMPPGGFGPWTLLSRVIDSIET